jgi:HEAT repeat protein
MRRELSAVLILSGFSCVLSAQGKVDPYAPGVAVPKAWSLLTSALNATDLQEQLATVSSLTIADTPRAQDLLEALAWTGTEPVRSTALWYLPTSSSRDYLLLVAGALHDPDLSVRRVAIQRLAHFHDDRALTLLRDMIARSDDDTIDYTVNTARNLGSSGIGVLLKGVESAENRVALASMTAIEVLIDPAISSAAPDHLVALRNHRPEALFIKALQREHRDVRLLAALILARLGSDAGFPELLGAAESSDRKFGTILSTHRAMAALHLLGRGVYLASLSAALRNPEQRVRADAAAALKSFPHASTISLWEEVWQGRSDLRYQAFEALIRRQEVPDLKLLREGLGDFNLYIRLSAAEGLLALGLDAEALDVVEQLAFWPETRIRALQLLNGREATVRTARLARALLPLAIEDDAQQRGYDAGSRYSVVSILELAQDREAVAALGTLLGPDRTMNYRVVRALVAIGGDAARETLVRAMDSPNGATRALAAGGVIRVYSEISTSTLP